MPVKPQFQIALMVSAMVVAGVLSYGILKSIEPAKTVDMTTATAYPPLPEAVFYDGQETPLTLADFKGQVVLVNLWATWCPPCVVELPSLDALQAKLADKDFRVIAISLDRSSLDQVKGFLHDKGIERLDVYWDRDRDIPRKWAYAGIPVSFLIDREGNVAGKFEGSREWDKGEMFEKVSALLP